MTDAWHERYTAPPLEELSRVGSPNWETFLVQSNRIAGCIEEHLGRRGIGADAKVLDFGAGIGRVALRLNSRLGLPTHACDINEKAMTYLSGQLSQVDCQVTPYQPPLPYEDASFDAIYSISIWTHLPPNLEVPWLNEIARVLKPSGVAMISFSGPGVLDIRRDRGDAGWRDFSTTDLKRDGILYVSYTGTETDGGERSKAYPGVVGSYGLTAHDPDYVRRVWGSVMPIDAIHERAIDNVQDLAIMVKPAS